MSELLVQIVVRAQAGESAASEELVQRFHAWACDYARAMVGDAHAAEDVAQQTLLVAVTRLRDLREPAAFAGWLRQILRTQCDHVIRQRRSASAIPESVCSHAASPLESAVCSEQAEIVRRALQRLPKVNRQAAELYYLDQRDCTEVAAMLKVPRGTVKRRLFDAREQLRAELRETLEAAADAPQRNKLPL